jgi:hypothetical protein
MNYKSRNPNFKTLRGRKGTKGIFSKPLWVMPVYLEFSSVNSVSSVANGGFS